VQLHRGLHLAGCSSQPHGVYTTSVYCGSQYLASKRQNLSKRSDEYAYIIFCSAACDGTRCAKLKSSMMVCMTDRRFTSAAALLAWLPVDRIWARARYLANKGV
jgi:hypothetical protein